MINCMKMKGGTTSMRHRVKTNKLNRSASHRKAMLNNMARNVFESGSIITTTAKAKEVRPLVENIITKAKKQILPAHQKKEWL